MRDIILTLMVFGSLPFILRNAYIGVLIWSWLSYMNPHRLTWGFAYSMPFAQIVAATLFIALFTGSEKNKFPINSLTIVWIIFLLWMGISTLFAFHGDVAFEQLVKVYKIQAIVLLTMLLFNDPKRIPMLIWVIVLSIGFFSVKGGIFTIMTGGNYRVWGPATSYISENNALAVATLMIIPLMFYLYRISEKKWVKYALAFSAVASLVSVVGSQSRGALLAIIAVSGFFWLKTKGKLISGLAIIALAGVGFNFMPESWHDRMGTIETYEEDASAMGRLNAWQYSINVASARLTGAGLESWSAETFAIYAPNPDSVFAAHSIFFAVLADHGWPGLFLYLSILGISWRYLSQVIRQTKENSELSSQNTLARMLQISMIAYMSGGAFLSLAYFDLPWHLIAVSVLLRQIVLDSDQKTPGLKLESARSNFN